MKIVKLQAENIKKLKAVEISPDGNLIKITGKNEQGKSTVLDSIWWALGGTKNIQEEPIRRGEKTGTITLELGDSSGLGGMIVTRTFTEKGSYLKVENKEGMGFKSPQNILDTLIGQLSFDPLAFAKSDSKRQVETLLKAVDIKVDTKKLLEISDVEVKPKDNPIEMLEEARKTIFDERTVINRQADQAKKALEVMGHSEPVEKVSTKELFEEKEKLEAVNRENDGKRDLLCKMENNIGVAEYEVNDLLEEISRLQDKLTEKKENLAALKKSTADLKQEVDGLKDHDLTDINKRIDTADEQNEKAQKYQDHIKQKERVMEYAGQSEELTKRLNAIKAYKEELVSSTKFPIDGLNFANGGITYNGIPFEQASGAQKLQVSLAIAMALNPQLRVIRIDEGTWLDSDHMKIVEDMAKENDFQIWMVTPGEDGKVGVLIEDGMVAN